MSHFVSNLLQPSSYHDEKKHPTELPPTPSSSAISFLVNDQKENESIDDEKMPSNRSLDIASRQTMYTSYGSLSSTELPASSNSTISPNDDDEGLYLLWTHQLLRERGYQPSSCKLEDEDSYSIDSSITDVSTPSHPTPNTRKKEPSFISSWLSCFPMC